MYRVIRTSMYRDPHDYNPITLVVREVDLREAIPAVVAGMEEATPGAFVASDVFEVDEATYADPLKVSLAVVKRFRDSTLLQSELDMAMCFYWNAMTLERVVEGGTLTATKPAPLTRDQLTCVLRQLALHPNYKGQTVIQFTHENEPVRLVNGKIK